MSLSCTVLPHAYQCFEERFQIDRRITNFVLPLGNNLNKNGTALYELVAAVFIAQYNHVSLDLHQLITLLWVSLCPLGNHIIQINGSDMRTLTVHVRFIFICSNPHWRVSVFDEQCDISSGQYRSCRDPSHRSNDHSDCFDSGWFTCTGSLHSGVCWMHPVS